MVLVNASSARLDFSARGGLGESIFTATLLAVFAVLPLVAPGPITGPRILFAALLLLTALGFLVIARPRSRAVHIDLEHGRIDLGAKSLPLARASFVALTTGGSPKERAVRTRYRAELVLEDGERVTLLERSNPALVLADLKRALEQLSLPVRNGWGLPKSAEPWRREREAMPPADDFVMRRRAYAGELGAGLCVLGGATVIGTIVALMHSARLDRGRETSVLSWMLSIVTISILLVLAAGLLTDRVIVRWSAQARELELQRRVLGLCVARNRIPLAAIRGVYAVGMTPGEIFHVLVDAGDKLVAIPFSSPRTPELTKAFGAS